MSSFPRNGRMVDGRSSWCRDCHAEASKKWREANPEKVEARNASRRQQPHVLTDEELEARKAALRGQAQRMRERQAELARRHSRSRSCDECSRSFLPANQRQRFCSDRCRYKQRDRLRYETGREEILETSRRYYAEHRDTVLARVKAYQSAKGGNS